ncbi:MULTISPECIES: NADP-dependent oxidoreductase [Streptomyces]|uniref:NADP-dependent oxidoreductase n=1 Tax=Streptomyces lonegramiae TaxID=3075524 RepID=A0ABU2X633_9ACTN|nr:NADP-dependent oxidoreductase [Streptomyces sp. DSM 41529]MDT0541374.1 NADP-dependent oxidoreductase [Streptomyces sp. DSM 41529]
MSTQVNRQIVLAARPHGDPKASDFAIVEAALPVPGDGQVLTRNILLSLDPYNRIIMGNANSDQPSLNIGDPMFGFTIAVIEQSNNPAFAVGDHVAGMSGWQDYAVSDGSDLRKIDPEAAPLSANLGVLGMTGLTAWVGLTKIINPKPGGTLVVTAAAGAVGTAAAQIGKLRGYRVVGVAGGPEKSRHLLEDLGLDAALDHKAPDFAEQLAHAVPDGIDTVYESVGASMFGALLPHLNLKAQFAVGGVMSQITRTQAFEGPDRLPDLLRAVLYKNLTIRGFSVPDHFDSYPAFLADLAPAVAEGKLRYAEHIVEGLENIPASFPEMFQGRIMGKMIAKISWSPSPA